MNDMLLSEKIRKAFLDNFNENPLVVRSPGRVNLIGEHTDYNNGFVLPAAIDKAIYFAVTPRNDNRSILISYDLKERHEFVLSNPEYSEKHWPNYLMGVVDQLNKRGSKLKGFNCVFGGDIPIGAGLSSSAAIEGGLAFTLNHIFNLGLEKLELVKLAQKAENEFVGVKCGIMDQYINIFGHKGNVLRIDCRSLEYEYFPFEFENISVVLFDSGVSHSLASSEYNKRRMECNEGVSAIKKVYNNVESLRDVSVELLNDFKFKLDPVVYKRCKYAVEENQRLLDACEKLNQKDLVAFGNYMYETHQGLSRDYEVSCNELDYLVDLSKENPKIYGSRMMGGGFGGCTINLIENDAIDEVGKQITKQYKQKFNLDAKIYITKINSGTSIIK